MSTWQMGKLRLNKESHKDKAVKRGLQTRHPAVGMKGLAHPGPLPLCGHLEPAPACLRCGLPLG